MIETETAGNWSVNVLPPSNARRDSVGTQRVGCSRSFMSFFPPAIEMMRTSPLGSESVEVMVRERADSDALTHLRMYSLGVRS